MERAVFRTSWVVERSLRGLPALAAVALVEGEALLAGAGHHFQVARRVFGLAEVPHAVNPATGGVRHVQNLPHRIHGKVVLVSRAGAGEARKTRVSSEAKVKKSQ